MERVAETSKHEPSSAGAGQARVASPSSASLPPALELQQLAGNQAMQQLLRSGYIQAKLAISNPDDLEEREADNVAHTVMRKAAGAPPSSPCSCSHDGEMCEECQQKQSAPLIQRRATAPSAPPHIPRVVSDVLRSPGYPLDVSTRAFFEPRFGRDFSDVRIHTSSDAAASARSINAHAYTAGSDIVFASSQYAPDTTLGRTLLAHELTHVMQQPKAAGAAAQTLQRSPDDLYKPTFDTDEQWRYGRAPLTASASMPPLAMVRKGQSSVTATAALKDLIERFPFLEPLAVSYRKVVEGVLGKDAADFNDARRVDTAVNRDYVEMASHAYSLPKDARRLMELGKFESIAANEARTEKIWPGWILSEAPIDVPSSPLAESDGRTYLRGRWEKVRQNPVFLVMDGWATPAIRLYISDGITDWEVRRSGKLLEMDDLLSVGSIRQTYDAQEKHGPKRAALENSLREVQAGLKGSRFLLEDQLKTNREATIFNLSVVAPVSEHLGKGGAGFDWLVDEYKAWATAPDGPAKGAAFTDLLDRYDEISNFLGGAGDAFSDLAKQYEQQVYSEIWDKQYKLYGSTYSLTAQEKKQAHTEGWARALKDWAQAPDELPESAQFTRVEGAAARAAQYLDKGDLQSAAVYLSVALEVEQRIAARIDRYKTRVTSGAASALDTLSHIETGAQIFLAVAGGAEFGIFGGAAIDATFTGATSLVSGESVGTALQHAGKAFLTDMVFGQISSAMSARLLSRGWSPFFAHSLAGVAALPYVKAAEIMYQKAVDPDSPMPDLTKLPEEAFESAVFGMLITAAHGIAGIGRKPYDPAPVSDAGIESKTSTQREDSVKLREQAKRQAQIEKELTKESARGSITPAEKTTLESSVSKSGKDLSADQALTEREIAHRNIGEPINEPPFTAKYKLPNGHEIKETPQGDMFERCSVECGIYDGQGKRVGTKQIDIPTRRGPMPPRRVAPENLPVVSRGANYEIRGDQALLDASRESGFHVYEYLNADGELLYVGKSGGRLEPNSNWINRLQSHKNTDWIADAVRVRVFYALTEQEMWAFEEVRIPESVHKDANVKPGEYTRLFGSSNLDENARSALNRPNAVFAIYAAPVR